MNIWIRWFEFRLQLDPQEYQMIYLNIDDQKKIWAPQIVIGSNMVSKTKEEEDFGVQKTWITYPHHCQAQFKISKRNYIFPLHSQKIMTYFGHFRS